MAMKWMPLDGKKDPQVEESYVTLNKKGEWDKMRLEQITITATGKTYLFTDWEGHQYTDCTHYLDINRNIEPLKTKE